MIKRGRKIRRRTTPRLSNYVAQVEKILQGKERGFIDVDRLTQLTSLFNPLQGNDFYNVVDIVTLAFSQRKLIARINEDNVEFDPYQDYGSAMSDVFYIIAKDKGLV